MGCYRKCCTGHWDGTSPRLCSTSGDWKYRNYLVEPTTSTARAIGAASAMLMECECCDADAGEDADDADAGEGPADEIEGEEDEDVGIAEGRVGVQSWLIADYSTLHTAGRSRRCLGNPLEGVVQEDRPYRPDT